MRPITIKTKFLLATLLLLSITCAAFSTVVYTTERDALMAGIDEKLRTAVAFAEHVVPERYHDHIVDGSSVSKADYLAITDAYNELCLQLDLQYLWSVLVLDEGEIVFTSGTSTSKHVENGDHALFFDVHSNPEAFAPALAAMAPTFSSFHNEWGHGRMLLVPGRDALGRVYMFGASMSLADVHARTQRTLIHTVTISLLILAVGSLLCFLVARSLSRPLERVTRVIRAFGRSQSPQTLALSSNTTEVRQLAETYNHMVRERELADATLLELHGRLIESEKLTALGRLAGGIAHDFANLLHVILSNACFALARAKEGSDQQGQLNRVVTASQRAAGLVAQILTYSREGNEVLKPVHLHEVLREAIELVRPGLPKNIRVRAHIGNEDSPVLANSVQLHQVVMNLIANAKDAMEPGGGSIDILLETLDASKCPVDLEVHARHVLHLSVRDSGCGMSEDTCRHVFDPYFTTKEKGRGTGLGLATVRSVVLQSGGHVDVETELGKGTTFHVFLPVAPLDALASHGETETSPTEVAGTECVLLVDDEPDVLDATRRGLEELGYTVEAFTRSTDALSAFRADPDRFDVVVTDEIMPDMTGHELAARMLARRPDCPIVLCTGYSEGFGELEAEMMGIGGFIRKPFLERELSACIRRTLSAAAEDGDPTVADSDAPTIRTPDPPTEGT